MLEKLSPLVWCKSCIWKGALVTWASINWNKHIVLAQENRLSGGEIEAAKTHPCESRIGWSQQNIISTLSKEGFLFHFIFSYRDTYKPLYLTCLSPSASTSSRVRASGRFLTWSSLQHSHPLLHVYWWFCRLVWLILWCNHRPLQAYPRFCMLFSLHCSCLYISVLPIA